MDVIRIIWVGEDYLLAKEYLAKKFPDLEWITCPSPGEIFQELERLARGKQVLFIENSLAKRNGLNVLVFLENLRERRLLMPVMVLLEPGEESQALAIVNTPVVDFIVKDLNGHYLNLLPAALFKLLRECEQYTILEKTNRELVENREKFQRVFMMNPNAMIISTLNEGRILEVNENGLKKTGFSREEMIGKSAVELGMLKAEERESLKKILEEKGAYENLELRLTDRMGNEHIGMFSAQMITLGGERFIIHSVHDITQRKKMEEELIKSKNLESIGILAGGLARDFNNILASIIGNISIARMFLHDSERMTRALNRAEDLSIKASELATKLLTFSEGGEPIVKENSMATIIKNTIDFSFSHSRLNFDIHLPIDLWKVMGDENQLNQLIYNIILNAEQAMTGEGGKVEISAENVTILPGNPFLLRPGNYIKIDITDTGEGIPTKDLDKIFDPFFSTRDTITRTGVGLGLTICQSIVKKHNGYIVVNSEVGKGTCITIYIPAYQEETQEIKEEYHSFLKGTGRILFMDDEVYIREFTQKMLEQMGYEVEIAVDSNEVLQRYVHAYETGASFQVVILNIDNRRGLGGKETLKKLGEINPAVKAVACCAVLKDSIARELKEAGFIEVIKKPYSITVLSEILNHVMGDDHAQPGVS